MGHGIGFLAEINQGAGDTTGDIIKRQVAHLAGGVAQTVGHLLTDGEDNLGMGTNIGVEIGVADFGNLTGSTGATPGTALFGLFKQAHLPKKITGVQISNHHFLAVIVLENDRDRTLDDVIQGIALVTFIDDGCAIRVSFAMTMGQEIIQILYVRRDCHKRHL
jgi:hypothetical protein